MMEATHFGFLNSRLEAKVARWKRRALQNVSPSRRPNTQDYHPKKYAENRGGFQIFLTSPTGSQKCLVGSTSSSAELGPRKSRKRIRDDAQTECSSDDASSIKTKLPNAMRLEIAFTEYDQDEDKKTELPLKGNVGICLRRQLGTLDLSIPVFSPAQLPSPSLTILSEHPTKKRRFQSGNEYSAAEELHDDFGIKA
mmetsp:Transcript_14929/g.17883  ORF Transcript_14929/g.17883 Transcript_14929/m.17883 type:complete len:196 (-) Transcript_14929:555-1142(-)|eukprot:jgi/Bigna1/87492/estExt_fgenesh1_pg.C_210015